MKTRDERISAAAPALYAALETLVLAVEEARSHHEVAKHAEAMTTAGHEEFCPLCIARAALDEVI